ncbi:GreA/GreB family elongation factor [Alishewanella longhuensis]
MLEKHNLNTILLIANADKNGAAMSFLSPDKETHLSKCDIQRWLITTSWVPLNLRQLPKSFAYLTECPKKRALAGKRLRATLGCSVQLVALEDGSKCWLKLTKTTTNLHKGELAVISPLGRAILGKSAGDKVQLQLGHRQLRFIITDLLRTSRPPKFT